MPRSWTEGAAALGVNRWRVMWTISVRAARPAIIAAAVLATARALGEAIMLSMVSGSVGFAPNPLDGLTFFFEPTRPLAATIVDNAEGLSVKPFGQTLYAFAAVLLVSSVPASLAGWAAKQPLQALRGAAPDGGRRDRAPARRRSSRSRELAAASTASRSALCWAAGHRCCALIAGAIVLYMARTAACSTCAPTCSSSAPGVGLDQSKTGGFLDPLIGTSLLTVLGTAIALPLGVATAVWLTEYGRPALARAGGRVGRRGGRRHARASCSRSSGCVLFPQQLLRLPVVHRARAARSSAARSSPPAR